MVLKRRNRSSEFERKVNKCNFHENSKENSSGEDFELASAKNSEHSSW
jgi:hypothetical protein